MVCPCAPKSSGWRRTWPWLVLSFAALNVIFLGGKRRAFGVFVAQLHVKYNETVSLAELNWIGDSYAALGYMTTTLSTSIILYFSRKFRLFMFIGACFVLASCLTSAIVPNPHFLFLTHTILHGIGSSIILSVVGLIVNEYFDKQHKYHILATTLVSGGSVASVIFVQMYAYIIEVYNWRNAFIILGVIYFIIEVSAVPFFSKNEDVEDYTRKSCLICFQVTIERRKWLLLFFWFIDRVMTSIVTYGMLMNLADYVRRREHSLVKSSQLTLLFAAGEASTYLIGALITGVTGDFLKGKLRYILLVTTVVMATLLFLWEFFAYNKVVSNILAFFAGFCMGPSITFLFPAGEELTRLPGHVAYPFSLGGMGVGMAISPSVTGLIAEMYQYKYFFLIQACMITMKAAALIILISLIPWVKKFSEDPDDDSHSYEELAEKKDQGDDSELNESDLILSKQKVDTYH